MNILELEETIEMQFHGKFIFHPDFADEFSTLLHRSGAEDKLVKEFYRKLIAITKLGYLDSGLGWLEHLKEYGNMYSLHLTAGNQNLRALFSLSPDGKFFLHTFYERGGKKSTSYAKHVPIAERRRDDYFKERHYE